MKVRIEKTFAVAAPADAAWAVLRDMEAVAACMPGARLAERLDDDRHKGTVTVKFGPATLTFRGEVEVREVDAPRRWLRLFAKGTDTTGTSGAAMDLVARVEPDGNACRLTGTSETSMSGKAAAFGGRVINTVADQVLDQFAANFAARAAAVAAQEPAMPAPSAGELNGFSLAWAAFKAWLRSLFTKTPA
ncbi:MAG TPA: SRPBCC family protein [Usitatibacter sp.]|nr:SRPBCC family protein [Usitatibacter sp.]